VDVRSGDGFLGWPKHAPFDGIIVTASASAVPAPLLNQLKPGGRLVMPVGPTETSTQLLRITKHADGSVERCSLGVALFVPMTGGLVAPFASAGLIDRSVPLCFGTPIVWII
jgi:protein-L-isoaspartate(D-aspartate) O-methyltransferase